MENHEPTRLSNNEASLKKQKSELFRQNLIEFIKKHDHSYEHINFSSYSTTKLVLLKVEIEITKKKP